MGEVVVQIFFTFSFQRVPFFLGALLKHCILVPQKTVFSLDFMMSQLWCTMLVFLPDVSLSLIFFTKEETPPNDGDIISLTHFTLASTFIVSRSWFASPLFCHCTMMLWFVKCLWFFFAGEAKFFLEFEFWVLPFWVGSPFGGDGRTEERRREHFGGVSKASSSSFSFSLAVAVVARRGAAAETAFSAGNEIQRSFCHWRNSQQIKHRTNVVVT